jgi:hypothetical protein
MHLIKKPKKNYRWRTTISRNFLSKPPASTFSYGFSIELTPNFLQYKKNLYDCTILLETLFISFLDLVNLFRSSWSPFEKKTEQNHLTSIKFSDFEIRLNKVLKLFCICIIFNNSRLVTYFSKFIFSICFIDKEPLKWLLTHVVYYVVYIWFKRWVGIFLANFLTVQWKKNSIKNYFSQTFAWYFLRLNFFTVKSFIVLL